MKVKAIICKHDREPAPTDKEYTFEFNPFMVGPINVGSKVMAIVRGRQTEAHVTSLESDYTGPCNPITSVVA